MSFTKAVSCVDLHREMVAAVLDHSTYAMLKRVWILIRIHAVRQTKNKTEFYLMVKQMWNRVPNMDVFMNMLDKVQEQMPHYQMTIDEWEPIPDPKYGCLFALDIPYQRKMTLWENIMLSRPLSIYEKFTFMTSNWSEGVIRWYVVSRTSDYKCNDFDDVGDGDSDSIRWMILKCARAGGSVFYVAIPEFMSWVDQKDEEMCWERGSDFVCLQSMIKNV